MTKIPQLLGIFALGFLTTPSGNLSLAQNQAPIGFASGEKPTLPDAPQAQPETQPYGTASTLIRPADPQKYQRYAAVIEPGTTPRRLSDTDKLIYSFRQAARPVLIVPCLYSATYEQLVGSDPKYGSDSRAFGAKFGAAALRTASVRILSDGVFASAFHQDPRYYRIAQGSIVGRGLRSSEEALVKRNDDGERQINFSGLAGRAAAAVLVLAYYPKRSMRTGVVMSTFGVSIATDAGGNLMLEFLPDLARRFTLLKKVQPD